MSERQKILIVDDEKPTRDALARILGATYECLTAPDADLALAALDANPDVLLVLTDYKMPGKNGIELIRDVKARDPGIACLILTAFSEVQLAVSAMKQGADDYFTKPVTDLDEFELRIGKAVGNAALRKEVVSLKSQLGTELENFTGKSPAMERVYRLIRKVAPTDATVLVEGPSGSGKELTARAIHNLSKRAAGPFVAVECAALSESLLESELFGYEAGAFTGANAKGHVGKFEAAAGGTLFLDEIGEISLSTQVKLLRALESRVIQRVGGNADIPVDFRLVAATNRNLAKMVAEGTFRDDLYYRLNVIDIRTPALKDHPEDIALLVKRFLKELARQHGIAVTGIEPAALKALEDYPWPGNVRQLRNVVEKMTVLATGPKITLDDVPLEITENGRKGESTAPTASVAPTASANAPTASANAPTATTLAETEKREILAALDKCRGNKSRAADLLGISRRTLHRKLNEWNLR